MGFFDSIVDITLGFPGKVAKVASEAAVRLPEIAVGVADGVVKGVEQGVDKLDKKVDELFK